MGNSQTYRPFMVSEPIPRAEGGSGRVQEMPRPLPRNYYPDPVRNYRKGANQWGAPQRGGQPAGGYGYEAQPPMYDAPPTYRAGYGEAQAYGPPEYPPQYPPQYPPAVPPLSIPKSTLSSSRGSTHTEPTGVCPGRTPTGTPGYGLSSPLPTVSEPPLQLPPIGTATAGVPRRLPRRCPDAAPRNAACVGPLQTNCLPSDCRSLAGHPGRWVS
eukprot:TRINITY_DN674_c0_g1_i4.p1 TRINITY_DN674_c0_g1~~TRINITY_DN674_c0_g1_i4.p1  ORF type:complete len:224 (-),score=4.95 TRINITY_DN674_c0_g1_i4:24-662(-)